MKKLKSIWSLVRAKYYAVLIADSEDEISWVINTLKEADTKAQKGVDTE